MAYLSIGSLRSGRPRAAAFFLAGILVGASVGLASGAIPATGSGVIYACYDNAGNLRVIDNETATCPKNQKSLSWSQNGPQGAQGIQGNTGQPGVQGATGPKGDPGDPGGTSLASLDGSACALPGGGASGVVTITTGGDGLIVLRCVTWCAAQTLPSGPHLSSTCDEATRTITTSCDTFWVDVNDDLGDGCERSYGQAAAELLLLHDVDVTVPASCGSDPAVGCVGGVPVDPLPTVHATGTNVVAQEVVGASRFDSSALIVLRTATPIPLTVFGTQCGFSIDTTRGSRPDVQALVRINFLADAAAPGGYRIVLSNVGLVGLEDDDISITGGFVCALAGIGLGFFQDTIVATLADSLLSTGQLCLAPKPELVVVCPA